MYCGICIEACPFDALYWTPEFEYAEFDVRDLLHDKDRLGDWMATVPPPSPHDPMGEPSKEEATAARKAAGPGTPTAAKTAAGVRAPVRPTAEQGAPPSRPASEHPQAVAPPPGEAASEEPET
jgi:NADH-quinone oxidoreductase subunit I